MDTRLAVVRPPGPLAVEKEEMACPMKLVVEMMEEAKEALEM